METVAKRIRYARESIGLKPSELAARIGITRQAYSKIGSGNTKNPLPVNLLRIADITGFEMRWLITGTGPETTAQALINSLDISKLPPEKREALRNLLRAFLTENPVKTGTDR